MIKFNHYSRGGLKDFLDFGFKLSTNLRAITII